MNSVAAALELKIASDNQKTAFDGSPVELSEAIDCLDREGNECIGLKAVVSFFGERWMSSNKRHIVRRKLFLLIFSPLISPKSIRKLATKK